MKEEQQSSKTLSNAGTKKKISFFAAMLIAMGSCIGAGIFFKAQAVIEGSNSSLVLAIICWLMSAFAVIAMSLALIEIASARNDNLSLVGWCQVFNSRFIAKSAKNFMFYIYLPLTFFFMPLYVINALQDAWSGFSGGTVDPNFGTSADWLIWTLISLAIIAYFSIASGLSAKIGSLHNKIILSVKFIPLVFVGFIGFILLGLGAQSSAQAGITIESTLSAGASLASMTPGIGMFVAVGAIFFAYDGFYVTAGLQSEMKEPKKTSMAILLGLGLVTIIYLIIAISMSIVGDGSITGLIKVLNSSAVGMPLEAANYLIATMNVFIAFGILGIINGFAMWSPRFIENLILEGEIFYLRKYVNRLNHAAPKIGIITSIIMSFITVVIFSLIGALGYLDTGDYGAKYGSGMPELLSFADLMGSWTAVFAFGFIMAPIIGGIINRKRKTIKVTKSKYFLPTAWISVIIVGLALFIQLILPFLDLFLLAAIDKNVMFHNELIAIAENQNQIEGGIKTIEPENMSIKELLDALNFPIKNSENKIVLTIDDVWATVNTSYSQLVLSRIMLVAVLGVKIAFMIVPTLIEDKLDIKKYGSIAEAEKQWAAKLINKEPLVV